MSELLKTIKELGPLVDEISQKMHEISMDIIDAELFLEQAQLFAVCEFAANDRFKLIWAPNHIQGKWRILFGAKDQLSRPLIEARFLDRKEASRYLPEFLEFVIKQNLSLMKD